MFEEEKRMKKDIDRGIVAKNAYYRVTVKRVDSLVECFKKVSPISLEQEIENWNYVFDEVTNELK